MSTSQNLIRLGLESNDYERQLKKAQKSWNDFTRGLGLDVKKFTTVGLAIGTVTTALKVAKDAFFKNEQMLDEWGRTVKSAESLYSGFLDALNTGNISGYLQNMNNIVNAARAAYDALDELGTFNAFNQINQAKAQTTLTEAIAAYREGTGSKEDVQKAAETFKKELQARQEREYNAYVKSVYSLAEDRGISGAVLQRILEGSNEQYLQYKNLPLTGTRETIVGSGFNARKGIEAAPADAQEAIGDALRRINDTELKAVQSLGAQAEMTANQIANIDKQVARVLRGNTGGAGAGGSGSGSGSLTNKETYVPAIGSIDEMTAKVKELQSQFNQTADQSIRGQLLVAIDEAQKHLSFLQGKGLTPLSSGGSLTERLGVGINISKELDKIQVPREYATSRNNENKEILSEMKAVTGSVTGIFAGVQKMGIELPEELSAVFGVMQGISTILTAILTVTTLIKGEQSAGTIVDIIDAILPFSHGGIVKAANGMLVPGNSFSGDNLRMPIMGGNGWVGINSGELILSRSQQDSIAAQLQDGGGRNIQVYGRIQGEDIILAADRAGQRRGYGQLMFGKNL